MSVGHRCRRPPAVGASPAFLAPVTFPRLAASNTRISTARRGQCHLNAGRRGQPGCGFRRRCLRRANRVPLLWRRGDADPRASGGALKPGIVSGRSSALRRVCPRRRWTMPASLRRGASAAARVIISTARAGVVGGHGNLCCARPPAHRLIADGDASVHARLSLRHV